VLQQPAASRLCRFRARRVAMQLRAHVPTKFVRIRPSLSADRGACPGRDVLGKLARPVGGLTERWSRRDDGGMERFVDDDAGYRAWLARHPDGLVINTGRTPAAAYLMLHRAACGSISGTPARGSTFTGDYAKVCGREELEGFGPSLGRGEAVQPVPEPSGCPAAATGPWWRQVRPAA
jgi:hypothetical protein